MSLEANRPCKASEADKRLPTATRITVAARKKTDVAGVTPVTHLYGKQETRMALCRLGGKFRVWRPVRAHGRACAWRVT